MINVKLKVEHRKTTLYKQLHTEDRCGRISTEEEIPIRETLAEPFHSNT